MATQPLGNAGGGGGTHLAGFLQRGARLLSRSDVLSSGGATTVEYTQRIFDTGLGQFVTYTKTFIDTAPAPGETVPNHTGSLDVATHEIL